MFELVYIISGDQARLISGGISLFLDVDIAEFGLKNKSTDFC